MVYANTILLATLGLVATSSRSEDLYWFRMALAILGLLLCASWFLLTARSFDFYKYWILSARELEEQHLEGVRTVPRGKTLADGEDVTIETPQPLKYRVGCAGRVAKVENVTYFSVSLFSSSRWCTL